MAAACVRSGRSAVVLLLTLNGWFSGSSQQGPEAFLFKQVRVIIIFINRLPAQTGRGRAGRGGAGFVVASKNAAASIIVLGGSLFGLTSACDCDAAAVRSVVVFLQQTGACVRTSSAAR
ncbi:unnamed protein product [Boreogadus saida]